MQAGTKSGSLQRESGLRLVGDCLEFAAGAEQADGRDTALIRSDLDLIGSIDRGGVCESGQRQYRTERFVCNPDRQSGSGLRTNVAAFVGNRREFVVTIGKERRVQRKRQIKVGGTGPDMEVIPWQQI